MSSDPPLEVEFDIAMDQAGLRLDVALVNKLPKLSRSYISRLLKDEAILLNSKTAKPSYTVRGGEHVSIDLPEPEQIEARPENIPLSIIFEDQDVIVINKPPGMVTHPSSGHNTGSLVNALLFHCTDLSSINGKLRPGIVHRLDKDTSGIIIAAKNDMAHRGLAEQFSGRTIQKEYIALCHGDPKYDLFQSEERIGRHPVRRTEMAVVRYDGPGREAFTEFSVLERFKTQMFSVCARPKTGRTHQIRVHLAKCGYPILADALYGKESALPEYGLCRQALHAQRLTFQHPGSLEKRSLEAPIPEDMKRVLEKWRNG